ncbi:DUF4240 domain-containing protein [Homoserinibacter sp. YIM 151385]|uniref:DUF4240 domain-containing protein n=1 Tax=Homoserinibacter sp. YIM 151385 TaxID=2985506 RepID=UPI0022F068B1|nr:DUF4240 domain-containing protein [Homoserinibacter sp. YIM 151385]WBU38478.1 DUF4240 domain-containing protein [Homoserinibacter sp. YIM 151385]
MPSRWTPVALSSLALVVALGLAGCVAFPVPTLIDELIGSDGADEAPTVEIAGPCPIPAAAAVASDPGPGAGLAAQAEAVALDEDVFWPLVDSIGELATLDDPESGFRHLSSQLAACPIDAVIAFDARMTLALHAIDDPVAYDWYAERDPMGFGPPADDLALYIRADTLLAGREAWTAALRDRTLPWPDDDLLGYGELLLFVGYEAAEAQGVGFDAYYDLSAERIPLSYETGANRERWNPRGGA